MTDKVQIGRLALRHEGEWWNAYYADNDTMKDAILLGSLNMAFVEVPKHKQQFMDLMRDIVSGILESMTGESPEWGGTQKAPEHERSGHG